jgi:hypothetical protein
MIRAFESFSRELGRAQSENHADPAPVNGGTQADRIFHPTPFRLDRMRRLKPTRLSQRRGAALGAARVASPQIPQIPRPGAFVSPFFGRNLCSGGPSTHANRRRSRESAGIKPRFGECDAEPLERVPHDLGFIAID